MNRYEIWQLDCKTNAENIRDLLFRSYDDVRHDGLEVSIENYKLVYIFETVKTYDLDELYYIFNMQRPDDFTGHSLSMSDVVKTSDGYYYCDSFGWKKLDWMDWC